MKLKHSLTGDDIKAFWHDGWKKAFERRKKEITSQVNFEKVLFETATAVSFDSNTKFGVFIRYQFTGLQKQFSRLIEKALLAHLDDQSKDNLPENFGVKILSLLGETSETVQNIISKPAQNMNVQHQAFFPEKEFFIQIWNEYKCDERVLEHFYQKDAGGFFAAWMGVLLEIDSQNPKILRLQKDIRSFDGNKRDKTFRYHITKVFRDERTFEKILEVLFGPEVSSFKVEEFLSLIDSARVARKNIVTQSAYYATRQQARTYKKFDRTPE